MFKDLPLQNTKILFVDDDPDITGAFGLFLQLAGAEVKICSSAQEAIEVCRIWSPDLLISDLSMPKGSGYDLIASVRSSNQACKNIPAIALSGVVDLGKALEQGFTSTIKKPIDPDDFVRRVSEALHEAH